jgi:hypothetical protein
MKINLSWAICAVIVSFVIQRDNLSRMQRGDLLDLTREEVPKAAGKISGGGMGVGVVGEKPPQSPLRVRLLWLDKERYVYSGRLVYEVSITNVSEKPVTIPWKPDRSYQFPAPGASVSAELSLVFNSSKTPGAAAGVHFLSGSLNQPRSLRTLRPAETVRIRAPGTTDFAGTDQERSQIWAALPSKFEVRAELKLERVRPSGGRLLSEQPVASVNSITVELTRR